MQYGICNLSIIPLRTAADHTSEMISQLLYGEHFKVLEQRRSWSRIRISFDGSEGWINNDQFLLISQEEYEQLDRVEIQKCSSDLVSFVETANTILIPIVIGSSIHTAKFLGHTFEGNTNETSQEKNHIIRTAIKYLNAPYQWGGRTPYGIDASGFTQIVYKINGYDLSRKANDQARQGTALSFIEESEPGDLAFFDNTDGIIDHVGIIMHDNYIIHVKGKVRIDRIDHTGIFNSEIRNYTHKLRVIKKII